MSTENEAKCADWLMRIAEDVRTSGGDMALVRLSEDGVTLTETMLSDELFLVATTLDYETTMQTSAELRERRG